MKSFNSYVNEATAPKFEKVKNFGDVNDEMESKGFNYKETEIDGHSVGYWVNKKKIVSGIWYNKAKFGTYVKKLKD